MFCPSYRCVADRIVTKLSAGVGLIIVHERVESAHPLQPPQRSVTRHLRFKTEEHFNHLLFHLHKADL
jgi:hypothetical protein